MGNATTARFAITSLCVIGGFVFAACGSGRAAAPPASPTRDSIPISIDTLLADRPGGYGYEWATKPALGYLR